MSEALLRTAYMPGHDPICAEDYIPTVEDFGRMNRALELGRAALERGDTPVGALLVHLPTGQTWEDSNTEFSEDDLTGHPEEKIYRQAQPHIGRDLSQCAMYCVSEPCYGCTYRVDKGNLGTLYIAALRKDLNGFFRDKGIDMDMILRRSRRSFTVVSGLMLAEAKELLTPGNNVHHLVP